MDLIPLDQIFYWMILFLVKLISNFSVRSENHLFKVSNGLLVGHRRKASRETWVYEVHEPMAPYLATLLVGRYEMLELGRIPRRSSPAVGVYAAVPRQLKQKGTPRGLTTPHYRVALL